MPLKLFGWLLADKLPSRRTLLLPVSAIWELYGGLASTTSVSAIRSSIWVLIPAL
ncbi:hypothetical protein D3C85_1918590 [compost metagenome]